MKKYLVILVCLLILSSSLLSVNAQSLEDLKLINLRSNFVSVSEVSDDQVRKLYQKNADAKMYPASMTKMLTIYTALLHGPSFDTQVVIEPVDVANLIEMNASVAGLHIGDVMTFEDLLYGIMLPSGADASNAVARVVSGSIEEFTNLMNETAQSIGMNSSHFMSATGLYDENHYSTANDIALLAQTALKNDQFKEIFSTRTYTTSPAIGNPNGLTLQTSLLMYANYDESRIGYIQGGKTGWIPESGYCLTSYSQFYDYDYVIVSCDAYEYGSQLDDHNAIYTFLFENMHEIQILSAEEKMGQVHLIFQDNPEFYEILNTQDVSVQVPIVFEKEDLTVTHDYIEEIITPVKKDTPIGSITFSLGDELLYETTYLFQEDIERNNLIYTIHMIALYLKSETFLKLLMIIGLILFILLVIILILVQYRKRQKKKDNYKGYKL